MATSREILEAASHRGLCLLPALSSQAIDELAAALPFPPPEELRDILGFCSGVETRLARVDFTGRSRDEGFGLDFLVPHAFPIADDGSGNYWVVDLDPAEARWGPVYFCCHDAPVMLVQAQTLHSFVDEFCKLAGPGQKSLLEDVHEDRLFEVWRKNPGVLTHAEANESPDAGLRAFASTLDATFEIIDLRGAPVGMGFSWGRYGPWTEVRRCGAQPIFACRKPEHKGLLSRLFGR